MLSAKVRCAAWQAGVPRPNLAKKWSASDVPGRERALICSPHALRIVGIAGACGNTLSQGHCRWAAQWRLKASPTRWLVPLLASMPYGAAHKPFLREQQAPKSNYGQV